MSLNVEACEVSVREIRMRYCRFGTGDKVMVILPGLTPGHVTDSAQYVAESFVSFANDFTVYLFDIEENVPKGTTVPKLAENTYVVMQSLGLNGVYLYGASLGGMLSICIDAAHPGFVKKLALASTLCKADTRFCATIERWITVAKAGSGTEWIKTIASDIYSQTTLNTLDENYFNSGNDLTENDLVRFLNTAQAIAKLNICEYAQHMSAETLLAWSWGDRIIDHEALMLLAHNIKIGEIKIYSDIYGHAVYDEAPDFKERMLKFFLKS